MAILGDGSHHHKEAEYSSEVLHGLRNLGTHVVPGGFQIRDLGWIGLGSQ